MLNNYRQIQIDALMTEHSKFRCYLNHDEYDFISSLVDAIEAAHIALPLSYQIKGSMLNFKIGLYQIGRLELFQRPYRIQILTLSKVKWIELDEVSEAITYISEWIKYCKKIDKK